ncbi:MAG: pyruvate kinase [Cumulibacter sp.]
MNRSAKIVCTLGPSSGSLEEITALSEAGMDVARMNFSHGTHADHQRNYDNVRAAAAATDRIVGVLADLQGPKIRLGKFSDGAVLWATGDDVVITTDADACEPKRIGTTYRDLANDVKPGDRLLIDDGNIAVRVVTIDGNDVHVRVLEGGKVSDHKGLSLPGIDVSVPALSEKDAEDLRFALHLGVDFVALSFVRSARDADLVRDIMRAEGILIPVIAKLEKPEAVDELEAIVETFDGIMVARGDLGVELPLEEVPLVQKRAVQLAREKAKPVIVATQMLESMITHSRPTRAEASDVANAVLDGADAVMLSGETSVGAYPVQAVRTMSRIIQAAESGDIEVPVLRTKPRTNAGIMARSARDVADAVDASAIAAFTQSGDTVRRLARLHSRIPVVAFTPLEKVRNQLALSWGIRTFIVEPVQHTDEMIAQVDIAVRQLGLNDSKDLIVMVAGSPPGRSGATNLIRIHRIGED